MDYLHGIVTDEEFEAACHYEYARESSVLRYAAKLRKRLIRWSDWGHIKDGTREIPHPANLDDEVVYRTGRRFRGGEWIINGCWSAMWQCASFPQLPWNDLGDGEREIIARHFAALEIQPLWMNDVALLDAMGVFRAFKMMAAEAREESERNMGNPKRRARVFPLLDKGQWVHALFTLDFSESKKRMLERFEAWLDLPENKRRLNDYQRKATGKTGAFKDRLKKVAEWRLYDELGFRKASEFTEANRKRSPAGIPRPFHDAREGQSNKVARNRAPLWSEESSAVKAKAKAQEYLAEMIPWEFEDTPKSKFLEKWLKCMKQAPKISKSSS